MRTTLNLDDDLVRAVKQHAARTDRTMTEVLELALRELLDKERKPKSYRLRWTTVQGAAPPTVDLTDRDALFNHMEAEG